MGCSSGKQVGVHGAVAKTTGRAPAPSSEKHAPAKPGPSEEYEHTPATTVPPAYNDIEADQLMLEVASIASGGPASCVDTSPLLDGHAEAARALETAGAAQGVEPKAKAAATPEVLDAVKAYFAKFAGAGVPAPPSPPLSHTAFSFVNSFVGIACLGLFHGVFFSATGGHVHATVPAFGALAVLLFSAWTAVLAQPWHVLVGNGIGGTMGVLTWTGMSRLNLALGGAETDHLWLTAALAVSSTIFLGERANAVHPPGGAMALAFVLLKPLRDMGGEFILCPALFGSCLLVAVAMATNNLSKARAYPQTSWINRGPPAAEASTPERGIKVSSWCAEYLAKFAGADVPSPPAIPLSQSLVSFLSSFVGIAALAWIPRVIHGYPEPLLIAPFGALAVLIFSAHKVRLAQPRHVLLGNVIGALVGVAVLALLEALGARDLAHSPGQVWLRSALGVSLTIAVQELLGAVHPPGGAVAMIYLLSPPLQQLGIMFVLTPVVAGSLVLIAVGVLTNNLSKPRAYPQSWR